MKFSLNEANKANMACNKPTRSTSAGKKMMVKACEGGKEKIVHFGAKGYGHNYSTAARKSFRARHKCDQPKSKLSAQYWACKKLWAGPKGSKASCPSNRKCKYSSSKNINEVFSFKDLNLENFYGKPALVETINNVYMGVMTPTKNGVSLLNRNNKTVDVNIYDIKTVICENNKYIVKEIIKPENLKEWNVCLSEARKTNTKGIIHKACKCYESKNGWGAAEIKQTKLTSETPEFDLILQEKVKDLFFNRINEEIVSHEHEHSMTPEEIAKRDEIAASLQKKGKCKIIKKNDKNVKNACHRIATYIVLGRGSGHATQKAAGDDWIHHHHGAGSDPHSMRHHVRPEGEKSGHYNRMAQSFLPGMFGNKKAKKGFHYTGRPASAGDGSRPSRSAGARASREVNKKHRESMFKYRSAMIGRIKDPSKRAKLTQNLNKEFRSRGKRK